MSCAAFILGAHLLTAHFGSNAHDLQSVTPGVYVQSACGPTAGAFRNSYGRASAYAGWTWTTDDGRFALTAGAVTGYPAAPVLPLLVPSTRLQLGEGLSARLALLPRQVKGRSVGLHLSIEREF